MRFPLSIGVCGSGSGAGKTLFIEKLIGFLKNRFDRQIKIIAIKYTKTTLYSQIISEQEIIDQPGKDTARMKKAGADTVYLIKATEEDLPETIEKLKNEMMHLYSDITKIVLIMEGNSLVRLTQPDVIIFFKAKDYVKPSGKTVADQADIIIEGKYSMEDIMKEIEKIQQKKLIYQLLKERSNDGKITCTEARKIAEEINVAYIEVGKAANELKIKIRKCELGCF